LPALFFDGRWLNSKNEEGRLAAKKDGEGNLEKYLERWGF
jgi:hypothetical protein